MNSNYFYTSLKIAVLIAFLEIQIIIGLDTSNPVNVLDSSPNCQRIENISIINRNSRSIPLSENYYKRQDPINDFLETELPPPTTVLDKLFSRVLFNTTMNYIVPLVKVTFPMHTDQGSTVHLAMQAFLGIFSAIAWVSTLAVPYFLTQPSPFGIGTIGLRRSLPDFQQAFSFNWKLGSIINEGTAKKIGLEWGPCFDKTICEAHRSPDSYGWIAFPFRVLYPAVNTTDAGEPISSTHAKAAFQGAFSDDECGKLYHCFFDVLPLAKYLLYACTH